jgi:hypothetical protein
MVMHNAGTLLGVLSRNHFDLPPDAADARARAMRRNAHAANTMRWIPPIGYPLSVRGQVFRVQGPLSCFTPTVLSS